jgi:polyhydroxybutyrate depolymerase
MSKTTVAFIPLTLFFLAVSAWIVAVPPAAPPTPPPMPIPTKKYQTPGDYLDSILVNGISRSFTVHIPPDYHPGLPRPLVINIHGRTATAFQQEGMTQMNAKADKEGFLAVNPQALGRPPTWWGPIPNEIGQPDMDFFEKLLVYLQEEISIDPSRIYATGMSNGATMANRLGCDMSDLFAAIAPVSGGHVAFDQCAPSRPVPVLVFHGLKDTMIPYHGNDNNPPVRAWVEAWAKRNGCNPTPTIEHPKPTISKETWADCDAEVSVILYSIEEAGHTWPGSQFGARLGGFTIDINATDVIWEFFASHPHTGADQGEP